MWKTVRPFSYRGKRYKVGDEVPAESWPARSYFVARRRIQFVKPSAETISSSKVKNMTRAELNVLAGQMGIDNPEGYPNREALIVVMIGEESEDDVVEEDDDLEVEVDEAEDAPEEDDAEEDSDADDSDDEDSEDPDDEEDVL